MSWMDINNNRAFLAGELSLTNNGISIYTQAKRPRPTLHWTWITLRCRSDGGCADGTERLDPMVVFRYSKYPMRPRR